MRIADWHGLKLAANDANTANRNQGYNRSGCGREQESISLAAIEAQQENRAASRPAENSRTYEVKFGLAVPPGEKSAGIAGWGKLEMCERSLRVIIQYREPRDLSVLLVLVATTLLVLIMLPFGWNVARWFCWAFLLWAILFDLLARKPIIVPVESEPEHLWHGRRWYTVGRPVLCVKLSSGKWVAVGARKEEEEGRMLSDLKSAMGCGDGILGEQQES